MYEWTVHLVTDGKFPVPFTYQVDARTESAAVAMAIAEYSNSRVTYTTRGARLDIANTWHSIV